MKTKMLATVSMLVLTLGLLFWARFIICSQMNRTAIAEVQINEKIKTPVRTGVFTKARRDLLR